MANDALSVSSAFGYLKPEEVDVLKRYSAKVCELIKKPVIVNIGAGAGTSGMALREGCKNAELYTVDISTTGPLGSLEGERNAFEGSGLELPIQILKDSVKYGKEWGKNKKRRLCNLVFVDGCHEYAKVINDINAWKDNLEIGGYFIFHDYNKNVWNGVVEAIDETIASSDSWKFIELVRFTKVFQKIDADGNHYECRKHSGKK